MQSLSSHYTSPGWRWRSVCIHCIDCIEEPQGKARVASWTGIKSWVKLISNAKYDIAWRLGTVPCPIALSHVTASHTWPLCFNSCNVDMFCCPQCPQYPGRASHFLVWPRNPGSGASPARRGRYPVTGATPHSARDMGAAIQFKVTPPDTTSSFKCSLSTNPLSCFRI